MTKMSRIIAHVGSQSEQGQQILSSIQASIHLFRCSSCLLAARKAGRVCAMHAPCSLPARPGQIGSFHLSAPNHDIACVQTKHAADEDTQEWLRSVMSVDAPGARRPSPLRSATTAPAALASALRPPHAGSPEPAAAAQAPAESGGGGGGASVTDAEQAQELLSPGSLRSLKQEDLEGLRGTLGGSGGSKTGTGGDEIAGGGGGGGGEAGGSADMDSGSGHVQAWHVACSHKH